MRILGCRKRLRPWVALLLCAALLAGGPMAPVRSYASLDEGAGYEEDGGDNGGEDSDAGDSGDSEDEPSYDNNATIQRLQREIDQANEQLKEYQAEQAAIQARLNETQSKKGQAEAVRDDYGRKIYATEGEIATLYQRILLYQEKIGELENEIDVKLGEIDQKQAEIDFSYEQFKTRLRSKYMQDNGSVLGLLLGADSFSDFLTRSEHMTRIGLHDRELMEELTLQRIQIEKAKAALEADKAQVEEDKAQVEADKSNTESKKQQLAISYSEANQEVQDIASMEAQFYANLEANKAMQAKMKAEIDNLYRELEFSKNPYVGGQMAWPLKGFTTISSRYGMRFGGSDFHTGTDITGSGCYGAAVLAANDGQVIFVNTSYTNGSGYGIYVMLDHGVNDKGQSVSTLYAHMSGVNVSVGQTVKRGETIGACGSTGWSTGPHLHFEVRLNGTAVDSLPYITQ